MINRRTALGSLTGVAAASLVLATAQRPAFAQQMAPMNGKTLGDSAYKMHTLQVGTLSKEISQLAQTKATHPKVREFSTFEVDEQTTVAQVLTNLSNPPPAPLDEAHRAILTKLQSASGRGFDAAYVEAEIQGHQQLLSIQQAFLSSSPSDLDHAHIAMLARTVIQMHLTMLSDLQQAIGAA